MTLEMRNIDTTNEAFQRELQELRQSLSPAGDLVSDAGRRKTVEVFGEPLSPRKVVERIGEDVKQHGVAAVLEYTRRLDGVDLNVDQLRVPPKQLAAAHQSATPEFLAAIRHVRKNVMEFQTAIKHDDVVVERPDGSRLTQRYRPLRRVGVCVPGGAAAYPSTVLMTVVPAQAAGVESIALVAPPTEFGARSQEVLATCHELGVTEVYQIGGAQAVAALAYGIEGLYPVDKIVGPGNMFVALAKQLVFGTVDIDSIAGPSEVMVIVDDQASPNLAAAEMLAQAEHSPGASLLVSWSDSAIAVIQEVMEQQLAQLSRNQLIRNSLEQFGAFILVRDANQACEVANLMAPEHLFIDVSDPTSLLSKINNVGAAFLGPHSPVAAGDYAAGPSHVLPTCGTPRWASGLSSNSFMRSTSVTHLTPAGLADSACHIQQLANCEGLTAHAASIAYRDVPTDVSEI